MYWFCLASFVGYLAFSNGIHNYAWDMKRALDKAVAHLHKSTRETGR